MIPALVGLTRVQVLDLANTKTPLPAAGMWTLVAPDGTKWEAPSPMQCVQVESKSRIPTLVALARIQRGMWDDEAKTAFDTLPDDYEAPH